MFFVWSLAKHFTKYIAGRRFHDYMKNSLKKHLHLRNFEAGENFCLQRFLRVLSEMKFKRFSVNNHYQCFPFYLIFLFQYLVRTCFKL